MPKIEQLVGFHIQAIKGQETDETAPGELETVETWTLILTDRQTQDQVRLAFRREARDELVRQLTSGVVLAGGEFPRI